MTYDEIRPIIVGGLEIEVAEDTHNLQMVDLMGKFESLQSTIYGRLDVPAQLQAQTLLHEVVHAISSIYLETVRLDETQCALLSQGLFQVLRDNPDLIEFILDAEEACNCECGEETETPTSSNSPQLCTCTPPLTTLPTN